MEQAEQEASREPRLRTLRRALTPMRVAVGGLSAAALVAGLLVVDSHRIDSAPRGGDPECSEVVDRLPEKAGGRSRDWALGDGVASWGDRSLVLRCGVAELQPNVNLCVTADGIDWVLDEDRLKADGVSVLTTYGRSPAVEVTYDGPRQEVGGILVDLNGSVEPIAQQRKCVGVGDIL
ncbi:MULTISPECIES: DUF3515 family protein [unclassified Streptomyces]|uniref:DUF3515 family protein n=1 Tax=unclassified Streptomyces TaxID=2593676 RepID=UPI000A81670C|nr:MULTISPECIES: DUF3515 family protein [unclassified Streptomyces]